MNTGEEKAFGFLSSSGWEVSDLTQCEKYFDKDIDFLVKAGIEQHTIEVKWDSRIAETGNMFIETITDLDQSRAGWFQFCQADYIFYGDSKNELFYIFRTSDLRKFVSDNLMQERKAADYRYNGEIKKVSQGMIVPINQFRKSYNVQVIKLQETGQRLELSFTSQKTV